MIAVVFALAFLAVLVAGAATPRFGWSCALLLSGGLGFGASAVHVLLSL